MRALQKIYLFLLITLFVGPGMTTLNKLEVVSFNVELLFNISVILFLYLVSCGSSRNLPAVQVISDNSFAIIPWSLMMLLQLIYLFFGLSFYETGERSEWIQIVQPTQNATMFLLAVILGSRLITKENCIKYLWVTTLITASSIVLDAMFPNFLPKPDVKTAGYAIGLFQQRNVAALILVFLFASSVNYSTIDTGVVVSSIVCFAAVICTLSRQGMIMMSLVILLITVNQIKQNGLRLNVIVKIATFTLLVLIFIIYFWDVIQHIDFFTQGVAYTRVNLLSSDATSLVYEQDRLALLQRSLEVFWLSPLIGSGSWYHISHSFGLLGPHNEFLRYAVDYGIIGISVLSAFAGALIWTFWKRSSPVGLITSILFTLGCLGSHNISETYQIIILLGLLLGMSTPITITKRSF